MKTHMKTRLLHTLAGVCLVLFSILITGASASAVSHETDKVPDICASATTTADLIRCGACDAANVEQCGNASAQSLDDTIANVVDILSVVIGLVAVIMIVIAGFRYITSGGAQDKVKSAKDTLLYAIIGLIIVVLAQLIVRFVLDTTTKATSTSSSSSQGVCQRTRNGAFWVGGPNAGKPC